METITKPQVDVDQELLESAKTSVQEENQVIVHVSVSISFPPLGMRIWPSTFLIPRDGSPQAKLLHVEGISKAPQWTIVSGRRYSFTLIFEGLSKDCQVFDLEEDIPSPSRFQYNGIIRNQSDVYRLHLRE
ncbi:hypothetical protein MMU07_03410 [Aquiflexum sp. LQ15W]|uniref:hypothetical protein n=1 Tax=Cognataquiflexum nitidum TaxID=2922272 RepID=UPI001F1495DB|nr:hypothetical protein [Cognataquiflexum nitidum]MCH6198613.1 hypothetical protein [Cognataquiflexum nitidum]